MGKMNAAVYATTTWVFADNARAPSVVVVVKRDHRALSPPSALAVALRVAARAL
jgi:hypothetical protein